MKAREQKYFSHFEKRISKGRWILAKKHQFYQNGSPVTACVFDPVQSHLLIGFQNGVFGFYGIKGEKIEEL
jgi:hypothetical protein